MTKENHNITFCQNSDAIGTNKEAQFFALETVTSKKHTGTVKVV